MCMCNYRSSHQFLVHSYVLLRGYIVRISLVLLLQLLHLCLKYGSSMPFIYFIFYFIYFFFYFWYRTIILCLKFPSKNDFKRNRRSIIRKNFDNTHYEHVCEVFLFLLFFSYWLLPSGFLNLLFFLVFRIHNNYIDITRAYCFL